MSDLRAAIEERFREVPLEWSSFRQQERIVVPKAHAVELLALLKQVGFDMLVDVTAVDYLHYPDAKDRFAVVYLLLDTQSGRRVTLATMLNEPDLELESVTGLWRSADWLEREVFDMFGIRFAGHPNLRRLLMPPEFTAHPLRKDYPLKGRGERHNFPVITRAGG